MISLLIAQNQYVELSRGFVHFNLNELAIRHLIFQGTTLKIIYTERVISMLHSIAMLMYNYNVSCVCMYMYAYLTYSYVHYTVIRSYYIAFNLLHIERYSRGNKKKCNNDRQTQY